MSPKGRDGRPDIAVEPLRVQRSAFAVPHDIAYFNTASLAPQLRVVRAAGDAALQRRAQPWNITSADWFADSEHLRELYGRLINSDADGVALVPASSYGLAVAARNLKARHGDRILVLADEYPSGIHTWRALARRTGMELLTVHRVGDQTWAEAVLAVLDERVACVSVPNVHWADGGLVDLMAIASRSHELGARLVIDASQSLGAMPLDIREIRPDFLVSVGYKWLLGPFSLGFLYVAEEHREGEPLEENWIVRRGSDDFAGLANYEDEYQPGARRFDVGQRTKFELTPMAIAAVKQVLEWQVPRIAAALAALTERLEQATREIGLEPVPGRRRGPHILGVLLPQRAQARILAALAAANCFAALRGGTLRIAPHLHVNDDDVGRLLGALRSVRNDS